MALNGEIELTWGDGEHKFNINRLKCLFELEDKCEAGFAEILQRIYSGKWHINDVRETLRLGLIGAGMMPDKALRLINRYYDDGPKADSVPTALAVLGAAMFPVSGDPLEKKAEPERAKDGQSTASTERSPAPSSMESAPPSDSARVN